ncbi:MAG: acetate--CoA ligase family protein, partial [Pseudomonadota bacterium]
MTTPDTSGFDALLNPRSIAVIGASEAPGKLGGAPIRMMLSSGYAGRLLPVNPRAETILGLQAHPTLSAIEGEIDLAVISIPAAQATAAVQDCAARGVRSAVVFSSGFAELGEAGRAEQARMAQIARAAGMRLLGPNTLGAVNVTAGAIASFCPFFDPPMAPGGSVGLVSQSGAFGGYVANLAAEAGLSFSSWITTGNEADIDLADAIAYQAADPATRVILAYMEGVRDGAKLIAALEAARASATPVIVLKVGRTEVGAAAAASHTGSLAGADRVYDAVLRQCGAWRARDVGEWFDLGYAFACGKPPPSPETLVVTVSGGVGVMMADEGVAGGLTLPELSAGAQETLQGILPYAGTRNPLDITGTVVADLSLYERMASAALDDRTFGAIAVFNAGAALSEARGMALLETWQAARARFPDAYIAIAGVLHPKVRAAAEASGILNFREPDVALRIAAAMRWIVATQAERPAPAAPLDLQLPDRTGTWDEIASLQLLAQAGLPASPQTLARTAQEAVAAAGRFDGAAVLKVVSADIPHKSDVGGVALDLRGAKAVEDAFDRILASARAARPEARIDGCLVAPMAPGDGVETIL